MLKQQFPFYFFHAHGCAFGAEFTKPFTATVESQAATAICSVGGHAFTSAGPFNFKEVVRFARASTQIAAIEESTANQPASSGPSFDTVVTCSLEGVNIFNHFTADEIVAHLSVKATGGNLSFNTLGTRFVNLRVGGVAVNPTLLHEHGNQYGSGETVNCVFDMHSQQAILQDPKSRNGHFTTLVSKLDVDSQHIKCSGNAIYVPDFGVVYLAEYLVTPNARQLNMFRIQFGCGVGGRASGSGVGANGTTCPPPP